MTVIYLLSSLLRIRFSSLVSSQVLENYVKYLTLFLLCFEINWAGPTPMPVKGGVPNFGPKL